jgi:cbb3-type cytochrome oxidase subunit 1
LTLLFSIPALAVLTSVLLTQRSSKDESGIQRFLKFGAWFMAFSAIGTALISLLRFGYNYEQTIAPIGNAWLWNGGFVGLSLIGATLFIVQDLFRSSGFGLKSSTLIYRTAVLGVILSGGALLVGGIIQGARMSHPSYQVIEVIRSVIPFMGINSLGQILFLIGSALLFFSLFKLATTSVRSEVTSLLAEPETRRVAP